MCVLSFHYAGTNEAQEQEGSQSRTRTVPVLLGYLTKGEIAKLSFETIALAVAAEHGENADLIRVVGVVQLKPYSQRRGVYFTKKQEKKAKARKKLKQQAERKRARKANQGARARSV